MASPGKQLLEQVYLSPQDLGARRLYADWLVEQGDPRGELIALQCARVAGGWTIASEQREAQLLYEHGRKWLGPFGKYIGGYRFERGFLAACELTAVTKAMIGHASWSTVSHFTFRDVDGVEVSTFLSHPVMRSLSEATGVGRTAFFGLCASGHGSSLRRLHVVGVEPMPIGRVKSQGGLQQLQELKFG
jgi:uncharacterized protein (TIGR02996 family)